ncbi:MAG: thiazole synthase [Bacteroidetes bacterium]|nr:thiazole synthase [Bacteroidota bacterium]
MNDILKIANHEIHNRLFIGTGKFPSKQIIKDVMLQTGAQVVTIALRRIDINAKEENILNYVPENCILMPNTSGARNAEEAIRIARILKESGCGNWIKIEIISDNKYLLPDNWETIKATEVLAKEGFVVMPYMSPDLAAAKRLENAGAASVMPLGAPIGSNRGIKTKELVKILINEIKIPVIVDAGIGKPSDATICMEMGCGAVLVNTAIATANNPVEMAIAFDLAVKAGRKAYLAGLGPESNYAHASSPLTGFLHL